MIHDDVDVKGPEYTHNQEKGTHTRRPATEGAESLGPLGLLPGTWANIRPEYRWKNDDGEPDEFMGEGSDAGKGKSPLDGRGWNMIALPFIRAGGGPPYRVMMNQYNEVLDFQFIDDDVPNRGIGGNPRDNTDQKVVALDYTQRIRQLIASDGNARGPGLTPGADIHHEPGFFLHMQAPHQIDGFSIARLATIPHGNAANAIGKHKEIPGAPTIPDLSGFPEGASTFDIEDVVRENGNQGYTAPYFHFSRGQNPFKGVVQSPNFEGFFPDNNNFLIQRAVDRIKHKVTHTTELVLDTDVMEGGIVNIPFIERQADAALMRSTFWIMQLDETGPLGHPRLILIYSQFILLDFFLRRDGREGLIRWPHISINMMEKIARPCGGSVL